jgi:glucose-1-phosphate thymidylyltransferase
LKVGSPEEAAWRQGFLTDAELEQRALALAKSGYGTYLLNLLRSNTV